MGMVTVIVDIHTDFPKGAEVTSPKPFSEIQESKRWMRLL